MANEIIITICVLLLVAYIFDLTASTTKIPSVILLLGLGYLVNNLSQMFDLGIPDLSALLPVLGTIGLILIVLEGSLELDLKESTIPIIKKSLFMAFVPMMIFAFALAYAFHVFGGYGWRECLTNAIPFSIISSAIAIPSVSNLGPERKAFVIYESSLSDIFGVIFFNFLVRNANITVTSFVDFFLQLILIFIISVVATVGLSIMLRKLKHHIKFVPILILIVLIYAVSKLYHLPALLFIMLFGLSIGNLDKLKDNPWVARLKPMRMKREVFRFKDIVVEATFLIRVLFFLLFGFLIQTEEILNLETLKWAGAIVGSVVVLRGITLLILKSDLLPLMFIAPRGLITILLFVLIPSDEMIPLVNKSLVIQVILLSVIIMMLGLMFTKRKKSGNNIVHVINDDHSSELTEEK
jgi:cell volume regulation protein A